jgi:hypothetical protein
MVSPPDGAAGGGSSDAMPPGPDADAAPPSSDAPPHPIEPDADATATGDEREEAAPPAAEAGKDGQTPVAEGGPPVTNVCPPGRSLAWRLDFTDPNWAGGKAGVEAALAAMGTAPMAGAGNVSVVADAAHGNTIKVKYPAKSGSISCVEMKECVTEGGLVFRAPLPQGNTNHSVLLSYWLKFDADFQWVKGGKLPGLCGGECPTGGRDVLPDRFSIRYMWRENGVGMVYAYLSYPPNPGTGLNIGVGSWRWQSDGQWHHVQEELVLNTANENDGVIRVWYDRPTTETPNFEQKNLRYYDRTMHPDLGIDKLAFSTFHGGEDASWSPQRDVYAYFADFQLCR